MVDERIHDQSFLLGQFVGMGQLVLSASNGGGHSQQFHTKEHLELFLSDVEKTLPLYLEKLDELKQNVENVKIKLMFSELDKLYTLVSYQSFKNFVVEETGFFQGYEEKMRTFSA